MVNIMAVNPIIALSTLNLLFYLLFMAAVLWYVYFRITHKEMIELASKIQGLEGLPIFGVAFQAIWTDPHTLFMKLLEISYTFDIRKPIKGWLGTRLGIFLLDPDDIEVILSSYVYIDKSPEYKFFEPWLGNGLLISEKWKAHRKLIAPTFHLNVLKSFITLFNIHSRDTVVKLMKLNNKEFDIHDYMSECTVEILLETAMGVSKNTQKHSGFEYADAVMKMTNILHLRHTRLWLRPDLIFNLTKHAKDQLHLLDIIHSLTYNVLAKKKDEYFKKKDAPKINVLDSELITRESENGLEVNRNKEIPYGNSFGQSAGLKDDLDVEDDGIGEKKRSAFLDLMIECAENGLVLSDKEVREQVDTIMFEGHDTTAAGSSFFLCLMGEHKEIQEKVVEELYSIFGDSDRQSTFQDTIEMKFLERCIMETLRLYPPVPIIARHLYENVKLESKGITLPAGATVAISPFKLHRNPDVFPNPEMFNPDNFLPEKSAARHYYSYIPFSAGPRSCVGRKYAMLKLKILLSTIIRNFKIHSTVPEKKWKLQGDVILKRSDGFKITLEPRKSLSEKVVYNSYK
ncbi:cytochrome P450 4g15-like isoform X2 [Daktulosphaira vitifoliae]|uniref:cytochrome P450 4g15-like isoform X2 n=1 Tax=Daktulosphaira vitifoliae TaxID=58002 RepID=UPI0021AA0D72|nr:cytochrome P450 4g15-like isoform X2 [Daktulosphaira vitifoliae]